MKPTLGMWLWLVVVFARGSGLDEWTKTAELKDTVVQVSVLNGEVVVVGSSSLHRAKDELTWSPASLPPRGGAVDLAFARGVYVAVGGAIASSSVDLKNWTSRQIAPARRLVSVTDWKGAFYALDDGGGVFRSVDGEDWQFVFGASGANRIVGGPLSLLCVGPLTESSVAGGSLIRNEVRPGVAMVLRDAVPGPVGWVGLGKDGGVFLSVNDGLWSKWAALPASNMVSVAFGGGNLVAVGEGNVAWVSLDASNWTGRFLPEDARPQFVVFDGSRFVAVSTDGVVYQSGEITTPAPAISMGLYPGLRISGIVGRRFVIEGANAVGGPWKQVKSRVLGADGQERIEPGFEGSSFKFYQGTTP